MHISLLDTPYCTLLTMHLFTTHLLTTHLPSEPRPKGAVTLARFGRFSGHRSLWSRLRKGLRIYVRSLSTRRGGGDPPVYWKHYAEIPAVANSLCRRRRGPDPIADGRT